jgi:CNT family concentrative nucleoside transporter
MSISEKNVLSEIIMILMTYALCRFPHPGSLGIMVSGMGTMVPERKNEIANPGITDTFALLMYEWCY